MRMVGVSQDITARRRTESHQAALIALGDGLRQMTDPADMSYLAAEILGTTLGVSRAGYGIIDPVARDDHDRARLEQRRAPTSLAGVLHFRDYGSYIEDLKRGETVAIADARIDPRTAATAAALEAIHARAFSTCRWSITAISSRLLYLNHASARDWSAEDLAFVRDVADRTQAAIERRQAETALAALAESLERQVEERTRESEAAQEQLRQAQKMEAVGQLTGGLAHDFNNLLTGISGGLELIEMRIKQGRSARSANMSRWRSSAAKRAAALTHRLLAFSRRQTLDPKPTDINRLIAEHGGIPAPLGRPGDRDRSRSARAGCGRRWSIPTSSKTRCSTCASTRATRCPTAGGSRSRPRTNGSTRARARERDLPPGQYVSLCVTDTGTGMSRRDDRARVRSLLHDQAAGRGHRARPVDDLRLRAPVGRAGADLFRARPGHDDVPLSPARHSARRAEQDATDRAAAAAVG